MNVTLEFKGEERNHYLETAARLRGMTRTRLIRRVLNKVLDDQLILAVLDDEEEGYKRKQETNWKRNWNIFHLVV